MLSVLRFAPKSGLGKEQVDVPKGNLNASHSCIENVARYLLEGTGRGLDQATSRQDTEEYDWYLNVGRSLPCQNNSVSSGPRPVHLVFNATLMTQCLQLVRYFLVCSHPLKELPLCYTIVMF
jgi:hypothetical protein